MQRRRVCNLSWRGFLDKVGVRAFGRVLCRSFSAPFACLDGNRQVTQAPRSGDEAICTLSPCSSTKRLTGDRPRPVPCLFTVRRDALHEALEHTIPVVGTDPDTIVDNGRRDLVPRRRASALSYVIPLILFDFDASAARMTRQRSGSWTSASLADIARNWPDALARLRRHCDHTMDP